MWSPPSIKLLPRKKEQSESHASFRCPNSGKVKGCAFFLQPLAEQGRGIEWLLLEIFSSHHGQLWSPFQNQEQTEPFSIWEVLKENAEPLSPFSSFVCNK